MLPAILCLVLMGADGAPARRGPAHLDFDDRLVQGQAKRAGAVYLYDRRPLARASLIKLRLSFREQIVEGRDGR